MSLWEKLERIDRRVLYGLLWIVVLPVLYYPINLPIVISDLTTEYYNQIEAIPAGSVVVLAFDLGPAGWPELGGMCYASMQHLFTRISETRPNPIKVVMLTYWATGAALIPNCFNEVYGPMDKMGAVYGEDWVNLGYIAGGEVGMSNFAADVWAAKPTDYQGWLVNDATKLPMMQNVRTIQDVYMLISIESGTPGYEEYLRQWWTRKTTLRILVGALGVSIPGVEPYRPTRVQSYLPGGAGASQYISLVGKKVPAVLPGQMGKKAVGVNDALSTSHILVIIFVALGNIGYFLRPRRK